MTAIRNRFVAFAIALAFFGTLTLAAAGAEQMRVVNTTSTHAWITLYADVGALGWTKSRFATPSYSALSADWVYNRGDREINGPWKVRFEVDSPNGRKYDMWTTVWYDGSQRRFNNAGDPNTYLYVCQKNNEFFWSFQRDCSKSENTAGI